MFGRAFRLGRKLLTRDEGPTMSEYVIMVALVAIACLVATRSFGTELSSLYDSISSSLATII
jgi:Flp pilus assembly pilin Flp